MIISGTLFSKKGNLQFREIPHIGYSLRSKTQEQTWWEKEYEFTNWGRGAQQGPAFDKDRDICRCCGNKE
ncbi:hypothetical protein JCM25156A_29610 [Komagataeibacter kakiaceti JCM 25156]